METAKIEEGDPEGVLTEAPDSRLPARGPPVSGSGFRVPHFVLFMVSPVAVSFIVPIFPAPLRLCAGPSGSGLRNPSCP